MYIYIYFSTFDFGLFNNIVEVGVKKVLRL